ncbi:MAG: hypothetical protein HQL75_16475 [Magnetococcales bacterium]|nr:hypothetical protein [Magnetococcales bacterium]
MLHEHDQELLSRGLDADLDRVEMRMLYHLAVTQPLALQEMAGLLGLERGLREALESEQQTVSNAHGTDAAVAAMVAEQKRRYSPARLFNRAWGWLLSSRSVMLQPFSFVGGAVAAFLVLGLLPTHTQQQPLRQTMVATATAPRLAIQEVQFSQAEARVNWTNRFIVPPGAATRLSLNNGGKDPVLLQFESIHPASLEVIHYAGGGTGETVRLFSIDGIGFATLREPRQGDEVVVKNSGQVPVLVYMRSVDGATVSDLHTLQKEKSRQNL